MIGLGSVSAYDVTAKVHNVGDSVGIVNWDYTPGFGGTIKRMYVNPGETINFVFNNQYTKYLTEIRFNSQGRSYVWDARLVNTQNVPNNFTIDVIFYKSSGYMNLVYALDGLRDKVGFRNLVYDN
jgi:hypothetical protein